jgi:uncharacterized protein
MEFEKCFFSNGIPLQATINIPGESYLGEKYPTVILCHGHSRHRNDGLDKLAKMLSDNGISSIRFNFRGCGQKAVNRYHLYIASEMPDDLINALSFTESLPFVDADRLGVAGISMGAVIAMIVCGSGEERIKSVVSMAGVDDCAKGMKAAFEKKGGDWDTFIKRVKEDSKIAAATGVSQIINRLEMFCENEEFQKAGIIESLLEPDQNEYLTLHSVASYLRVKPIDKCESIKCPIFFIHGEEDEYNTSALLYEKVKVSKKKLKVYKGIDHNIPVHKDCDIVFKDIVEWFLETL